MVRFFYENYDFDEDKNYLIYYRGNFGPPTKGHFSVVEKFIEFPNVHYFISQIGSEKRHGVPYKVSETIWKKYIKYLLPSDRITLRKLDSSLDVLSVIRQLERRGNKIDKVIFVKGIEWDFEENSKHEEEMRRIYYKLNKKLKKYHSIDMDFCFLERDIENISASKFVEAIKNRKNAHNFLPEDLHWKTKERIIRRLSKYELK